MLVADDYTDLLVAFKRLLEPSCDVVGCVADGDALLEALTRLQPDVVIVDLFIPPSDGIAICRHIKEVAPETLVIIVSASPHAEVANAALGAGAFAFVNKVAAVDELAPAVLRAMAARSG